jgi:hypothetical protein
MVLTALSVFGTTGGRANKEWTLKNERATSIKAVGFIWAFLELVMKGLMQSIILWDKNRQKERGSGVCFRSKRV